MIKFSMFSLFAFGFSALAATNYSCVTSSGVVTSLEVRAGGEILWGERNDFFMSPGEYMGREQAATSPWQGFLRYELTDYHNSETEKWIVAVSPDVPGATIKAVQYFDQNGQLRDIREFACTAK